MKTLSISLLIVAFVSGCAAQQPQVIRVETPAPAAPQPPPQPQPQAANEGKKPHRYLVDASRIKTIGDVRLVLKELKLIFAIDSTDPVDVEKLATLKHLLTEVQ